MKINVCAVVVTYNRKELLKECLDSILSQTYSVSSLIVIDNASTDGTSKMLEENYSNSIIKVIHETENLGGAGGFYEGIKISKTMNSSFVWVMDDDTVPLKNSLNALLDSVSFLSSKNEKISFLASSVYGEKGEFMNVPTISLKPSNNGYAFWYKFLGHGLVNIENATFVSLLINSEAISRCGLPCKDFFIWGDDTEYTTRLTHNFGNAYLVGNSLVIHKRKKASTLSLENETDSNRMKMYHYFYRNSIIILKFYYGKKKAFIYFLKTWIHSFSFFGKKKGFMKRKTLMKGLFEYQFQYKKFKRFINAQLKGKRE